MNLQRQMDGVAHTESFEDNSSVYATESGINQSRCFRLSTFGSGKETPGMRIHTLEDDDQDSGAGLF